MGDTLAPPQIQVVQSMLNAWVQYTCSHQHARLCVLIDIDVWTVLSEYLTLICNDVRCYVFDVYILTPSTDLPHIELYINHSYKVYKYYGDAVMEYCSDLYDHGQYIGCCRLCPTAIQSKIAQSDMYYGTREACTMYRLMLVYMRQSIVSCSTNIDHIIPSTFTVSPNESFRTQTLVVTTYKHLGSTDHIGGIRTPRISRLPSIPRICSYIYTRLRSIILCSLSGSTTSITSTT